VAKGQARVMELGGNLPESLLPYTILGHPDTEQNIDNILSIPEKTDKVL
jgi:hypothetical protein